MQIMKTLIIRDDDTSAFTRPEQLETIYGPVWERGLPVSLAVIPRPRDDVRVWHRPGLPYDPSIPVHLRGQGRNYPLTENPQLCAFLNEKAAAGLVEIVLHGYEHNYHEFDTATPGNIETWLRRGKNLLQNALPDATLQTFVAPYDRISSEAIEGLRQARLNLCTFSQNLLNLDEFASATGYQRYTLPDGRVFFTCDEYLYTHRHDPAESLATARYRLQQHDLLVVANHYWSFFYDWDEPNRAMLDSWHTFLDDALQTPDLTVTTFAAAAHL